MAQITIARIRLHFTQSVFHQDFLADLAIDSVRCGLTKLIEVIPEDHLIHIM